jgi:hypothetical protein
MSHEDSSFSAHPHASILAGIGVLHQNLVYTHMVARRCSWPVRLRLDGQEHIWFAQGNLRYNGKVIMLLGVGYPAADLQAPVIAKKPLAEIATFV